MKQEIEVKFLHVDPDEIRRKLKSKSAKLVEPMRLMQRCIIESEALKQDNAFVRIRDEGDKVTLTYKQFRDIADVREVEVIVDSFERTKEFFEAVGMPPRSYQQSKRETWTLDECEVVIDAWPWLDPYVEIEGDSIEAIRLMSEKLGFVWQDGVFGDVMAAYRAQYPHLTENDTIGNVPQVLFGDDLPRLLSNVAN